MPIEPFDSMREQAWSQILSIKAEFSGEDLERAQALCEQLGRAQLIATFSGFGSEAVDYGEFSPHIRGACKAQTRPEPQKTTASPHPPA